MSDAKLPTTITAKIPQARDADSHIHDLKRRSLVLAVLLFGVGGAWASFATLTGAVIAPGFVVVESSARSIQHLTGGVVEKLLVRDGDTVKAGDLLVKLDETQVRAQLQIQLAELDELQVRQARLDAEQKALPEIVLPPMLERRRAEPALSRVIQLEQIVLNSRQRAFSGQQAQLEERIKQITLEGQGLTDQLESRRSQAQLIDKELGDLEQLFARNLVSLARISGLRREQARLRGEVGATTSEIARSRARISETELLIIQAEQQRRTEITQEARDVASKIGSGLEKRTVLEDQLSRVEIRSPSDGQVHQMILFTIGGVVKPGETLMRIVPLNDEMSFEVRIQPRDIDQVKIGHAASIRLSAANQPTTQNFDGVLTTVSPDLIIDAAAQQRYFTGRVKLVQSAQSRPNSIKLQPGMPAEVYIKTDERSPISYLLRPLLDQAARAFRER